jgi:DNA-binding GntR family transcriptional regulator
MPFERVFSALRDKIESGELLPGEQMPTLVKISEEYGISRTTAQKVISALAEAGFVEIKPRWGTFVAERSGR